MGDFTELITDLGDHNSNNFVYLVSAFTDSTDLRVEAMFKLKKIKTPSEFYSASLIGKLTEERTKALRGYRGEIEQLCLLGDFGYIIKPASEDAIRISWNHDIGTPRYEKEWKSFMEKHDGKKKGAFVLLAHTNKVVSPYNEVVLQGDPQTDITGIICYKDDEDVQHLKEITESMIRKRLPIIQVDYKRIFEELHLMNNLCVSIALDEFSHPERHILLR